MQSAVSRRICIFLPALLLVLISPSLRAQAPQIDALADQMSGWLAHANLKTVLVVDFAGPYGIDAVGRKLAADFRASLSNSRQGIQVVDYSIFLELLKKKGLMLANVRDAGIAGRIATQSDAEAWIYGTFAYDVGSLKLTVGAYPTNQLAEHYFELKTSIPLTDDLKALIAAEDREYDSDDDAAVPRSGRRGYSYPTCIDCPFIRYTDEATLHQVMGTIVLEVTVDTDGRAKDVKVKAGLPYGMTQQAIDNVKKWKFKPAAGPDGKPAAVRQEVDMTVHME